MSRKTGIGLLVVVLIGVGLGWYFLWGRNAAPEIKHVILISMDTTRADRLSCYGYPDATTPHIDALAAEGIRFAHTIAPIPSTLPSHTSMLTGTIPPHHGRRHNGAVWFDPSLQTLAETMKSQGYATGAFIGAQVLNRSFGLNRGFDVYHDEFDEGGHERAADEVNRYALDWLGRQGDNSVFLFLHYYDPHDEYEPPEPFASTFAKDPYAGEIAWVDDCIGKVIDELKARDMYDSSLIIVTGDHGEMLGEHGEDTHTYFIYEGAVHVPMVWKLPGNQAAGTVVEDVNGIVDIVPTLGRLLGTEVPQDVEGVDVSGYFRNEPPPLAERYVYCESLQPTYFDANGLFGLVGERWKYIRTTRPELYDLTADPSEQNNVIDQEARVAASLQANLEQISREAEAKAQQQEQKAMTPDLVKHLQSLGYVGENSTIVETEFDESKPDPKDLVSYHNKWCRVTHLVIENKNEEALAIIEQVNSERPSFLFADLATRIYLKQQDYARAVEYGEQAVSLRPGYFLAHEQLAFAYSFNGNDKLAAEHFELALNTMPDAEFENSRRARLAFQLGMTYARLERFGDAYRSQMDSLKIDAKQPLVVHALAQLLLNDANPQRDEQRALQFANQACVLTGMRQPALLQTLAEAHAKNGDVAKAIEVVESALSLARAAGDTPQVERLERVKSQYQQILGPGGG